VGRGGGRQLFDLPLPWAKTSPGVTLRLVRATIDAVAKLYYILRGQPEVSACNADAPFCHLWPAPLYNIFPLYLVTAGFSERGKKVTESIFCL
jgi:hypothetical protein